MEISRERISAREKETQISEIVFQHEDDEKGMEGIDKLMIIFIIF